MADHVSDNISDAAKAAVAEFSSGAKLAYSVLEFSVAASVGRSTVYEEITAGRLRARKIGNRTVILAEDARAYLLGLPRLQAA